MIVVGALIDLSDFAVEIKLNLGFLKVIIQLAETLQKFQSGVVTFTLIGTHRVKLNREVYNVLNRSGCTHLVGVLLI